MIQINNKKNCCGCNACAQICPQQCITMVEDEEGFLYPNVDEEKCINCGLCEKVCPVIHQEKPKKPLEVYATKNKNEEIRTDSSSGGMFQLLAEHILNEGGVVFGAKFNDQWEVEHDYTETIEGLTPFRNSKYVQSNIGASFIKVRSFLKEGRKVLFTGTACQIAGLNLFLRKKQENLLTIDVVCHGVPSRRVWRQYLKENMLALGAKENSYISDIKDINFRKKKDGWSNYSFHLKGVINNKEIIIDEKHDSNIYMKGFLKNIYLRPSCHYCPAKKFKSGSDLTLGDFWGVSNFYPNFNDEKGISLVTINSEKGKEIYYKLKLTSIKTTYDKALKRNPSLENPSNEPIQREFFYCSKQENIIKLIKRVTKDSLIKRSKSFFYKICSPIVHLLKKIFSNFFLSKHQ